MATPGLRLYPSIGEPTTASITSVGARVYYVSEKIKAIGEQLNGSPPTLRNWSVHNLVFHPTDRYHFVLDPILSLALRACPTYFLSLLKCRIIWMCLSPLYHKTSHPLLSTCSCFCLPCLAAFVPQPCLVSVPVSTSQGLIPSLIYCSLASAPATPLTQLLLGSFIPRCWLQRIFPSPFLNILATSDIAASNTFPLVLVTLCSIYFPHASLVFPSLFSFLHRHFFFLPCIKIWYSLGIFVESGFSSFTLSLL